MTSDIKKRPVKVVIDTNVLISALGFGGKPRQILLLTLEKRIKIATSPILLAELHEVVNKKFPLLVSQLDMFERKMKKKFFLVHPTMTLTIARDIDDNRVLEAAIEGECDYIITGDQDLLELKTYKNIIIVTPAEFLDIFEKSK